MDEDDLIDFMEQVEFDIIYPEKDGSYIEENFDPDDFEME